MSKTQNQSVLTQDNNPLKEIQSVLNGATDALSLRAACFDDISTIFDAICKSSDKQSHEHRLAKVGAYLTTDWSSLCECNLDDLKAAIEAVKNSGVK